MITPKHILKEVQAQNWRDHGGNGGVDEGVMADIGFTPFDRFDEVIGAAAKLAVATPDLIAPPAKPSYIRPEHQPYEHHVSTADEEAAGKAGIEDARKHL